MAYGFEKDYQDVTLLMQYYDERKKKVPVLVV